MFLNRLYNYRMRQIERKIRLNCMALFPRVTPINEQGVFNQKCFLNAVQYATKNNNVTVHECYVVDPTDGEIFLHYINKRDGDYLETSMGFECGQLEYYVIREIKESCWQDISPIFTNALLIHQNIYTTWFDRYILRLTKVV